MRASSRRRNVANASGRDPRRSAVAGVKGHRWPRLQGGKIPLQALADALSVTAELAGQTAKAALLEVGVQGGKAGEGRDRHQKVAPGVADQTLDLTLVVAFARSAEAVEEQVMRLQLGKGAGPLPLAATQDPGHRQLGVVVEDRTRHPAQEGKGRVVAVEEGLGALGRVG